MAIKSYFMIFFFIEKFDFLVEMPSERAVLWFFSRVQAVRISIRPFLNTPMVPLSNAVGLVQELIHEGYGSQGSTVCPIMVSILGCPIMASQVNFTIFFKNQINKIKSSTMWSRFPKYFSVKELIPKESLKNRSDSLTTK